MRTDVKAPRNQEQRGTKVQAATPPPPVHANAWAENILFSVVVRSTPPAGPAARPCAWACAPPPQRRGGVILARACAAAAESQS